MDDVVVAEDRERFGTPSFKPGLEIGQRANGQARALGQLTVVRTIADPDAVFKIGLRSEDLPAIRFIEGDHGARQLCSREVGELRVGVELMELIGALDGHMNT